MGDGWKRMRADRERGWIAEEGDKCRPSPRSHSVNVN